MFELNINIQHISPSISQNILIIAGILDQKPVFFYWSCRLVHPVTRLYLPGQFTEVAAKLIQAIAKDPDFITDKGRKPPCVAWFVQLLKQFYCVTRLFQLFKQFYCVAWFVQLFKQFYCVTQLFQLLKQFCYMTQLFQLFKQFYCVTQLFQLLKQSCYVAPFRTQICESTSSYQEVAA